MTIFIDKGFVTLESELYLDQFLGFSMNGTFIPPTKVYQDAVCSKFLVRVLNIVSWRLLIIMSFIVVLS